MVSIGLVIRRIGRLFMASNVKNILDIYSDNKKKIDGFIEEINQKIESLENQKYNNPVSTSISDEVLFLLKEISEQEENNKSFDDADIQWYLEKYGHCGIAHNVLREVYNEGINKSRERKDVVCLPFFRFSKENALELLNEVEKNYQPRLAEPDNKG